MVSLLWWDLCKLPAAFLQTRAIAYSATTVFTRAGMRRTSTLSFVEGHCRDLLEGIQSKFVLLERVSRQGHVWNRNVIVPGGTATWWRNLSWISKNHMSATARTWCRSSRRDPASHRPSAQRSRRPLAWPPSKLIHHTGLGDAVLGFILRWRTSSLSALLHLTDRVRLDHQLCAS